MSNAMANGMAALNRPGDDLIDGLKTRYSEPERHYHTWAHIEALIKQFEDNVEHFKNPTAVLWALYWHDAIYDPRAFDNEVRSALLLREEAQGILSSDDLDAAALIINATAKHLIPDNLEPDVASDTALFLDMDLSILGQPDAIFDAYEVAIAKEFSFLPEGVYTHGRRAVLEDFLARDQLFFTKLYRDKYEGRARENLERSIASLS